MPYYDFMQQPRVVELYLFVMLSVADNEKCPFFSGVDHHENVTTESVVPLTPCQIKLNPFWLRKIVWFYRR